MTAYQRGNRDGLLAFAAWADKQAELYGAEVQRFSRVRQGAVVTHQARAAAGLEAANLTKMVVYSEVARQARRMAEALPEEPGSEDSR